MEKIGVISLGCAKNLVDTEIMLGQLIGKGWELTTNLNEARLILINTCGFVGSAKEESINHILEAVGYKDPGQGVCTKVVVTGCLVQRYAAQLAKEIPEVDLWVGLGEIGELAGLLMNDSPSRQPDVQKVPFLNDRNLTRFQVTVPHLAYVKIAEGCSHCCSYCAIPLIKGSFRSRSPQSIIQEIAGLVQSGVKEINLIAQDITMYGQDLDSKINLLGLLTEIIAQANPPWIRLLYAYPSGLSGELLEFIASQPSICKYLDLPIQHINSRILRLMNRHDPPKLIRAKLTHIKETMPEIVLRTTLIVGFPTETNAEFLELKNFVAEGLFQHLGVFTYSREEETIAYDLMPQIRKSTMELRKNTIMETQQHVTAKFLKNQVGSEQVVLVDQILPGGEGIARSTAFAPEVDGIVKIKDFHGPTGEFSKVLITGWEGYNLFAKYLCEG